MAPVGLLLNPPKSSQSDVSYVSYESDELCKKKKPGENGGVQCLHCRCKGFGEPHTANKHSHGKRPRARFVGSSSAVVPSPWRLLPRLWKSLSEKANDWRRQGGSHQRANEQGKAKERQRPTMDNEQRLGRGKACQCRGNEKV